MNFWFQSLTSEKLKVDKHWRAVEKHLEAIENMEITTQKMKNILEYHGVKKVTNEMADYYRNNILEVMKFSH